MDSRSADSSPPHTSKPTDDNPTEDSVTKEQDNSARDTPSMLSTSSLTSWAQNLKLPETGATTKSAFSRMASGISMSFNSRASSQNETASDNSETSQSGGVFESITKGLVDTSLGAVKAVQVKARHLVSQNKRRYQEGGFDLDMTYITENILAMGFPAGDMSSGLFGYFEGLYRNHMEEVIKFFETHHKGKYKVYNLCSERLYDASLFEGKVATFPFDDHNCPPLQLIKLFCVSAYSWLKEDILNVVVVHCKAGMARTGLMICSLLLYLKFFPTAEECINYYNPKRCIDGKGLILPSQIRYVKYFERVLTQFNGETPAGRRCMLRGFRLHKCPYWVRPSITISNHNGILFTTKKHPKTKDLMAEDFWIRAPKKGIVVFALPGEPGLTEVIGDFKIHFHDRQGDFYCWLNTSMMENRMILSGNEFEDFDKRKLPSPGFEVEIVMVDYDGTKKSIEKTNANKPNPDQSKVSTTKNTDDDVFSDSDEEESTKSKSVIAQTSSDVIPDGSSNNNTAEQNSTLSHQSQTTITQLPSDTNNEIKNEGMKKTPSIPNLASGDIKAMAADASVFTFGDDEDYETE